VAESRGMGRGLAAILPGSSRAEGDAQQALRQIPVDLIRPNPDQPRKEFNGESLLALAESIEAKGVLQPLVVRALPGGTYELIAGERRLRASKIAKLEEVPAIIRDAEGSERLELALLENVAREDLNPVDEARACAILVDDLGVSKAELASRIGRSRPAVANAIRLLDLPDDVLERIEKGELTGAHGRALLMTRDNEIRRALAREAVAAGWSVKETEKRAKAEQQRRDGTAPAKSAPGPPADLVDAMGAAADALTAATGHDVKVKATAAGVRAEISFETPAEAVALAELILRRNT
jgi:ParB family transcriptional regulator, chromosome partitioning protein